MALATVLAIGALVCQAAPPQSIEWQPSLALAEPWRFWSAAFMHWSGLHLAANLAGCVVVAAYGAAAAVDTRAALAWLLAWPLTHAALALRPELTSYAGLSGVLHAGVAIASWHLVRQARGARRAIGVAVLLGLALKLVLECPWGPVRVQTPEWDFAVAPLAHLTGTLSGLVCAQLLSFVRPRRPK